MKISISNQYFGPFILRKKVGKKMIFLIKNQKKDERTREIINIYIAAKLIDINYEEHFINPIVGLVAFYLFHSEGISKKEIDKLHDFFKSNIVDIEKILKD